MTTWMELACDTDEAVALLRGLWELTDDGVLRLREDVRSTHQFWAQDAARMRPVAGSDIDQYDGRINPLWEILRWFPLTPYDGVGRDASTSEIKSPTLEFDEKTSALLRRLNLDRQGLCTRYSYSICSPGDITWMRQLLGRREVVELGAGRGYWAWQLEQAGVRVHAYDPLVPGTDNRYFNAPGTFTKVHALDHTIVTKHSNAALFMSWPGYECTWAHEALASYAGDMLIYAGEGPGGCTADDAFYDLLESEWEWLGTSREHPTWWGIHDSLSAYVRS
jgi:hypothetical protein